MKTPTPVATPLPPRNFSQTGKQWPRTAADAATAARTGSSKILSARKAGRNPFRMSMSATGTASFQPFKRRTFVAPVARLPNWRISFFSLALKSR